MKSLKEHKAQILAAIALAFSLGMVVPSAVFASDGMVVQADGTVVGSATAADLMTMITEVQKNADYAKGTALVNAYGTATAQNPTEEQLTAVRKAITDVDSEANVSGLTAAELAVMISGMKTYQTWKPVVTVLNEIVTATGAANVAGISSSNITKVSGDKIQGYYNTLNVVVNPVPETYVENIIKLNNRINTEESFVGYKNAIPMIAATIALEADETDYKAAQALETALGSGAAGKKVPELIEMAKKTSKFDQYRALYESMGFIRSAVENSTGTVDDALLKNLLSTKYKEADLANYYSAMATAAKAIDPAVMNNLLAIPNTSAGTPEEKPTDDNKVNTPNTGIVGLFESGALDLGMITLIASVAVAGVAGVGVIAKLYLKKKF